MKKQDSSSFHFQYGRSHRTLSDVRSNQTIDQGARYPRKFFEGIRGTGNYSVLIDANKPLKAAGTYCQAGAYDNEILCEECEKKFSDFDNYGQQILGKPSLANPLYDDFEEFPYAYKIDCNTDKIRRFILAVLWRASISRNSFYSAVNLGPYESRLKARLFDPTPLTADEFPTVATRLETDALGRYSDVFFQPFKARTPDGLNSHVLFLPLGLKFLIITGQGKFRGFVISEPNFFVLYECRKRFMRELDYVPAMIGKMRRAEAKSRQARS